GTLLDGMGTVDAPEFRTWLEQARDDLVARVRDQLLKHTIAMEPARAAAALRALLRHDALDEEVVRAYLAVCLRDSRSTGGLRAYRAIRHNLHGELGVAPNATTQALAAELEELRDHAAVAVARPAASARPRRSPATQEPAVLGVGTP